ITMPFTRHLQANGNEVTAVGLEYDDLQDVTAAALARYRDEEQNEPADAGSRRALGAEHETLERAGL
ncbi:MAG: hypothetical protein ACOH2J_19985, partial [Allorhizobium sp.]